MRCKNTTVTSLNLLTENVSPDRHVCGQYKLLISINLILKTYFKAHFIYHNTAHDKRNFRKKVLHMEIVAETGKIEEDVARRAAKLYRFDKQRYDQLTKQGFNFEI